MKLLTRGGTPVKDTIRAVVTGLGKPLQETCDEITPASQIFPNFDIKIT